VQELAAQKDRMAIPLLRVAERNAAAPQFHGALHILQ
jgi:hypothetical protein